MNEQAIYSAQTDLTTRLLGKVNRIEAAVEAANQKLDQLLFPRVEDAKAFAGKQYTPDTARVKNAAAPVTAGEVVAELHAHALEAEVGRRFTNMSDRMNRIDEIAAANKIALRDQIDALRLLTQDTAKRLDRIAHEVRENPPQQLFEQLQNLCARVKALEMQPVPAPEGATDEDYKERDRLKIQRDDGARLCESLAFQKAALRSACARALRCLRSSGNFSPFTQEELEKVLGLNPGEQTVC